MCASLLGTVPRRNTSEKGLPPLDRMRRVARCLSTASAARLRVVASSARPHASQHSATVPVVATAAPGPVVPDTGPLDFVRVVATILRELGSALEGWSLEDLSLCLAILARIRAEETANTGRYTGLPTYGTLVTSLPLVVDLKRFLQIAHEVGAQCCAPSAAHTPRTRPHIVRSVMPTRQS